jgi:hypothetical protein
MPMIWYSANGSPTRLPLEVVGDVHRPREQTTMAELCAQDFYSEHDGWEVSWPTEIKLYESHDGPALATLEVGIEMEPRFYGSHKA